MGVLLKVQPMFVSSTPKKNMGYTVLMDVPPKVQPVCLLALKPKEYITIIWVCYLNEFYAILLPLAIN